MIVLAALSTRFLASLSTRFLASLGMTMIGKGGGFTPDPYDHNSALPGAASGHYPSTKGG